MKKYIIKKAKISDLEYLLLIESLSFKREDRFSKRTFNYHIIKEKTFIIRVHQEVVGYMILVYYKYSVRIYSLAVLPKFRKNGIASKLIKQVFDIAKEMDKKYLFLEVNTSNKKAISLYKGKGFSINSSIPDYYHDGSDAYKMRTSNIKD